MSKSFDVVFKPSPEQALLWNEGRFFAAVERRLGSLMTRLREKISSNLHGGVLESRTGRLAGSLSEPTLEREGDALIGDLEVGGNVPYAVALERGTGPYEIIAAKKALRFVVADKAYFRKLIERKATLERSYFLSAIDGMEREFLEELTSAVGEGLSGE